MHGDDVAVRPARVSAQHLAVLLLNGRAHREELALVLTDRNQDRLVARRPSLADVVVTRHVPVTYRDDNTAYSIDRYAFTLTFY